MNFIQQQHLIISVEKAGPDKLVKQSFPLRFGKYSEIKTPDFEFCFNLNGEIKSIRGLKPDWPHPAEQFKRTAGNDWIYYTVGDKSGDDGIISWMGEYYLPCLPYSSNPVWEIKYFSNPVVMSALAEWSQLFANLYTANSKGLYPHAKDLIKRILVNDERILYERSQHLNKIIGGRVSVLPPDTRHVDYDIIPLTIADGCLYHCKFCCVKTQQKFQIRSKENIYEQLRALKDHFGDDLVNYHALFLANHDALAAGENLICFAAEEAYQAFGFRQRMDQKPFLYLFGSVGSFLEAKPALFEHLNRLPFYTYINIGFESIDSETLSLIGKPITSEQAKEAFEKMIEINAAFDQIEVTGNFVAGDNLSPEHEHSLADLLKYADSKKQSKGAVYISPLKETSKKRELLPRFYKIKEESRLPVFVYLIQRL
ncbi:radical SAM protein [Desulfotignum phosphitoxidans]|uniref:Radical SAM domain-containing protein n=1 Tax=Desulfotignum phosphitoxidans DSM 13687 TaxID=1286635 RepID=S0G811_9BACT|nr:radical SAM protein [Desulfotignum phosphitoxidans]EMS81366.1 radical SAM domain-containing protein [Desulfotignum phosphitoxidans DSM 13687]